MRSWLCALAVLLAVATARDAAPAQADDVCLVVTVPAGGPAGGCVPYPFAVTCRTQTAGSAGAGFATVFVCYPVL